MVEVVEACGLCGAAGWCGRPCFRDPEKRNGLIFWPDGRLKTLKERGLGVGDDVTENKRAGGEGVTENSEVGGDVTENRGRGRPKVEGAMTGTERVRKLRALRKELAEKGGG